MASIGRLCGEPLSLRLADAYLALKQCLQQRHAVKSTSTDAGECGQYEYSADYNMQHSHTNESNETTMHKSTELMTSGGRAVVTPKTIINTSNEMLPPLRENAPTGRLWPRYTADLSKPRRLAATTRTPSAGQQQARLDGIMNERCAPRRPQCRRRRPTRASLRLVPPHPTIIDHRRSHSLRLAARRPLLLSSCMSADLRIDRKEEKLNLLCILNAQTQIINAEFSSSVGWLMSTSSVTQTTHTSHDA